MTTVDSAAFDRLRAAASEARDEHHLPGLSVGVIRGDDLIYCESIGLADIESAVALNPARRHRIASVTKTMVGLCAMSLADEERLSLDERVTTLLPDVVFNGPAESMTVRHLLTHTSGIGEAPTAETLADTVDPSRPEGSRPREFPDMYPNGITIECEPGTKWAYANHGFALLGEIIVRAEGASLNDVMTRRIFEPLGMRDTDCIDASHDALTTGYHRAPNEDNVELLRRAGREPKSEPTVDGYNIRGAQRAEFDRAMLATGGVQSNMPDMARYASALLRRGAGIVRSETFDAMVAPQWCPDGRFISWGLSISRNVQYGRRTFGHSGAYFGGWNTTLTVLPAENLVLLVATNVMLDEPAPIGRKLLRALLDLSIPPPPDVPLNTEIARSASGVFELTSGYLTNFRPSNRLGRLQITARDGALFVHSRRGAWKDGARLLPADIADPSFFLVQSDGADPVPLTFLRGADGGISGLRTNELIDMIRTEQVAPWA